MCSWAHTRDVWPSMKLYASAFPASKVPAAAAAVGAAGVAGLQLAMSMDKKEAPATERRQEERGGKAELKEAGPSVTEGGLTWQPQEKRQKGRGRGGRREVASPPAAQTQNGVKLEG